MKRVPWVWPACACALVAGPALADLPPVTITNTLVFEGHTDSGGRFLDDQGYTVIIDRLNLQTRAEAFDLSLRLDAVGFSDPPPGSGFEADARPERVTGRYSGDGLEVTGGDFFRQLGRGLLLSIRKVDEVGLDLSLRGADARWTPDGHTVGLFAGVLNPANLDAVSQKPVDDVGDLVTGFAYELGAIDQLVIGAHALYLQPGERLLDDELDYTISGGGYVELHELVEGLTVYAELDAQSRRLAGSAELGWAGYLTADLSLGDVALLVEGLWLDDFEQKGSRNTALGTRFDLNQAPTLERIDQEVINNRDVRGVRARAEYSFLGGRWIAYVNGVVRINDAGEPTELRQLHGYAGGEHHFDEDTSKLIVSAGYRDEAQTTRPVKSMVHGEVDLLKALGAGVSLHLTGNVEVRSRPQDGAPTQTWVRGSSFVGAEWADVGGLTVEIGYDTEKPDDRNLFVAGIMSLTMSDLIQVRALGGTQRGGLKCANGVCREFPQFAGVRMEIVARL